MHITSEHLTIGGARFELLSQDDEYFGIGGVWIGDTLIRSADRPMRPFLRTPDGIELSAFRLLGCEAEGIGMRVRLAPIARNAGMMELMLHTCRNRWNLNDWRNAPWEPADTQLELLLMPHVETLGGIDFAGFTYQYRYASADHQVYQLLDRASWEPGGSIIGASLWLRSGLGAPVTEFRDPALPFSTEWYLGSAQNPNIFQFVPLFTEHQGFTFTASESGVLLTAPERPAHIRSLFEKPRGEEALLHYHQHCQDLAPALDTVPIRVLWSGDGQNDEITRANQYEWVREDLHRSYHDAVGLRQERAHTAVVVEEWGLPDLRRYADEVLPEAAKAGAKILWLPSECQNNMNEYDLSNMCCTIDNRISDQVGGEGAMAYLCEMAHALGMAVSVWINTSISSVVTLGTHEPSEGVEGRLARLPYDGSSAELIDKHPDALIKNLHGAIEADHYSMRFCCLNLRSEAVREYWHRCYQRIRELGVSAVFMDSSFNLSSDKFHYVQGAGERGGATADQTDLFGDSRPPVETPTIQSMFFDHLDLVRDMQQMGYAYSGEDSGVFGIHRTGPGHEARFGREYMFRDYIYFTKPEVLKRHGRSQYEDVFRSLANRHMPTIYFDIDHNRLPDWVDAPMCALIRAYEQVESNMNHRTLLADHSGVRWDGDGVTVLWSYATPQLEWAVPASIYNVMTGERFESAVLIAQAWCIYMIAV